MLKPSLLILSLSLLTMSFSPLSSDSSGAELDPHAYVRVGHPGPWIKKSNTLVVPHAVACGGGGFLHSCELYLDIDVDGGNTGDPDFFIVTVYKNNIEIDSHWLSAHRDRNITAIYTGNTGDRFHLYVYFAIVPSSGGWGGGTSYPSITAELNI